MDEMQVREDQRLLKARDVAAVLNISRALAYRLMRSGQIPVVRVGHAVRVIPADLAAYINSRRIDS
jgi:excisionase family DNA binding protein